MTGVDPTAPTPDPMIATAPPPYREWRVLPIATLTSIATVIGSGILALPVTLYATAVPVFLFLFTVSALAQVAVVFAIVELLQRARNRPAEPLPASPTPHDAMCTPTKPTSVSLYDIADLYLPNRPIRALYFLTTFGCFTAILVSYGLAGPQAVWQLLTPAGHSTTPPPAVYVVYCVAGTAAVVFFVDHLLGVFGSFTVLKGALFVVVVFIIAALPDAARVASLPALLEDASGWQTAGAPFLLSCVALGGLANTTPVTFNLLPLNATAKQVGRYRVAILVAVLLCYLLNVAWVLAVLQVVPREAGLGEPSLTVAYEEGQISTVPLIDALHNGRAVTGLVLKAVEVIVELFIFVSTGVSFFVTAAGMKNFVDGAAAVVPERFPVFRRGVLNAVPYVLAYVLSFGTVLAVVVTNPEGFIAVLTRFVSFNVNLQAGAVLFLMLYNSRKMVTLFEREDDNEAEMGHGTFSGCLDISRDCVPEKDEGSSLFMSDITASTIILFGSAFFLFACLVAIFGPMFGIELNAPRE